MTTPKRLVDTEAVAVHYQRAAGTVRYWASVHNWTPYGTRRHRLWDLDEIQAKFDEHERQQRMADTQELLTGAFAFSPLEAADPVALRVLIASIDRELERHADQEHRVIRERRAEWTLSRRSDVGELVDEPWSPGDPTTGAEQVICRVEATTESTWFYDGTATLAISLGEGFVYAVEVHAALQDDCTDVDALGIGRANWSGEIVWPGQPVTFRRNLYEDLVPHDPVEYDLVPLVGRDVEVRLPDGRTGMATVVSTDGETKLGLTGNGRPPYAVHGGALSAQEPAESAPRRET